MASARFAWGIDIGNRALKAVKLVRDGDQLRVDDFELIEHETVLSNSGDNRENFVQTALASFTQRHPIKGGAISVGVSGQQSFARFIKLPPVESKKIPEIVRFEAIQQIPFPLDDVEWSYQLFQQPDSPDVEVGIFAMRKELVNQHIKHFTDFDLNVQVVQMNPLAVYNAMHYDDRLTHGTTMIIDLGAENTDLIIADRETVWMRSIPIGGNNFTQTLEKAFKLPFVKAEELKRNAATSKYARQIFQAMRPVFADLVAEIQRSIGFYASVHRDSRIRKIMALGGTFKLPGLQKYLQQNLQLDVERPDHIAAGVPEDTKLASTFQENLLSVIGAYGLAIQAMGDAKITSSLLPQRIRREKMWKEKTKWFAATAALFALGTAIPLGAYVLQDRLFAAQADEQQRAATVLSQAQTLDQGWQEIESFGSTERAMIANLQSMVAYRDLQRNLLMALDGALPAAQPPVLEGLRKIGRDTEAGVRLIKQVPRNQRKLIVVESVQMQYLPDVTGALTGDLRNISGQPGESQPYVPPPQRPYGGATEGGFMDPGQFEGGRGPMPPMPPMGGGMEDAGYQPDAGHADGGIGEAQRGYVVTIRCMSPNAAALDELIPNVFIPALNRIGPTAENPHQQFAVKRATMTGGMQLNQDPTRLAEIKQAFDLAKRMREFGQRGAGGQPPPGIPRPGQGPGGFRSPEEGGWMPPPGGAPDMQPGMVPEDDQNGPDPAFLDRLLGEDIRDDWEFTISFVVVLDPVFTPGAETTDEPPEEPTADAQP